MWRKAQRALGIAGCQLRLFQTVMYDKKFITPINLLTRFMNTEKLRVADHFYFMYELILQKLRFK